MAIKSASVVWALIIAVTASCFMSADPSLYEDASWTDGPLADTTPVVDSAGTDGPAPDLVTPDAAVPDAGLATYQRKWVTTQPKTNPGALWGPKLAYEPATGKVVLYGGRDSAKNAVGRTWTYDGTDWLKVCDPCTPGPRVGHGMVTDLKRGVIVLFGGESASTPMNDVWEYSGGAWKSVTPAGKAPSARSGAFMAYDEARGRVVIIGGRSSSGTLLDDVHEYDGKSWYAPVVPAVHPTARLEMGHAATFADANALEAKAKNRVIIFGGETAAGVSDDCWTWDGAAWTPICTDCTKTARRGAALGYDPATGRLVVVNGWSGSDEIAGTFEFDGKAWAQTSTDPGKRDNSGIAFDAKRNRFVVFGGNGDACGGNCDETLEYVAP